MDPAAASDLPIPATILGGFLGSGKTTLLNVLLRGDHGLRLAVIVNEFGAVGVDGARIAGGAQFVELDNGCLCCALNEDLTATLHALRTRGGFDHVVVETTGMADPLPVAWGFTRPVLAQAFRVDAIVVVVDARALVPALTQSDEARVQLTRADIVVLNKLDLVDDGGAAATAALRAHCPLAPVLPATHGEVPLALLLAHGDAARPAAPAHAHVHAPSFESYVFAIDAALDEARLYDFCDALPASVFRLKGFVRTTEPWEWTLVNVVAGRIDVRPCQPTRAVRPGLVFIGPRLDRVALATACAALVNAGSD